MIGWNAPIRAVTLFWLLVSTAAVSGRLTNFQLWGFNHLPNLQVIAWYRTIQVLATRRSSQPAVRARVDVLGERVVRHGAQR